MNTKLNFSNNYFKNIALSYKDIEYANNITAKDAFMLCIKDLPYNDLDNLCIQIHNYFKNQSIPIILTKEECYSLTQSISVKNISIDSNLKELILQLAYNCIHSGNHLGTKTTDDGKFITSSWLSHSLFQGETASILAENLNLDSDTAKKLGILHDIGRKKSHLFDHTIKGFEFLIENNFLAEAFCCLTHSFIGDKNHNNDIKGNRCANCDKALDGFFVNEQGTPCWESNENKDDITIFLENYNYNYYDLIINLADLMATDRGIFSPYIRVKDIATRKEPDPKNRNFFKVSLINLMNTIMNNNGIKLKATQKLSDQEIEEIFIKTSNEFYNYFCSLQSNLKDLAQKRS